MSHVWLVADEDMGGRKGSARTQLKKGEVFWADEANAEKILAKGKAHKPLTEEENSKVIGIYRESADKMFNRRKRSA